MSAQSRGYTGRTQGQLRGRLYGGRAYHGVAQASSGAGAPRQHGPSFQAPNPHPQAAEAPSDSGAPEPYGQPPSQPAASGIAPPNPPPQAASPGLSPPRHDAPPPSESPNPPSYSSRSSYGSRSHYSDGIPRYPDYPSPPPGSGQREMKDGFQLPFSAICSLFVQYSMKHVHIRNLQGN